jgi:hypothetical protein
VFGNPDIEPGISVVAKSPVHSPIQQFEAEPGVRAYIVAACQRRGGCLYAKKEQKAHSEEDRSPFT